VGSKGAGKDEGDEKEKDAEEEGAEDEAVAANDD
jgi:hypothetical protein